MVNAGVGVGGDLGLGAVGDPEACRFEHREIVGAVADGERLSERKAFCRGDRLKRAELGVVAEDRLDHLTGQLAAFNSERIGAVLVGADPVANRGRELAKAAGFESEQANVLLDDGSVLLGIVAEPILGREAKLEALERATRSAGLHYAETLAVGDGANDLAMIRRAGLGVAYHAKPIVAAAAGAAIAHGDLTALLYLQGYRRDEIVGL